VSSLVKQTYLPARADQAAASLRAMPEIDGLRAIAVISVFVFHLDPRLLGGGFVGVDIFFVISGYLITALLSRDIETESFSLLRFYQRRVARIAPASFLVLAVTIFAGAFLYSSQDFASLGANSIAASLSFTNIKLLFQGSYFEISPDAQPLMHFWSLALEEQFYIIFPIILYILIVATERPLLNLLTLFAFSFVACAITTPLTPTAAFYLLPTRAWELLAGSCLAIIKQKYLQLDARALSLSLAGGLILIFFSLGAVPSEGFPGWRAALPVAGAILTLAGAGDGRSFIGRFLGHSIMVFIGKRSYSLYLWHWPIFSFVDYRFFLSSQSLVWAMKIVLTVSAALAAYRFVETPMRRLLNAPQRRATAFAMYVCAAAALSAAGYLIRSGYYLSAESGNVATGGVAVNPTGRKWVVVIGDSQGAMYGFELASLAHRLDFRLNILSVAAGNEMPGEDATLWPQVIGFLDAGEPDVILFAEAWSSKLTENGKRLFGGAIAALAERTARIIVLEQPPTPPRDATRPAILAGARPPFFEESAAAKSRAHAEAIIREFESRRVQVLDVADIFLNNDGSIRMIGPNGRLTYQDSGHLSDAGTALVRRKLEDALRDGLRQPK
jgi:peptidoglycan/LPS O-acetylase OafA/YrhL